MTMNMYNLFILHKKTNHVYWCIYHSDDSGVSLIFNNLNKNYESFSAQDCLKLKNHLNKYGYELEHQDCEDFCNVSFFSEINEDHEFHVFDQSLKKSILLDFFNN